MDSVVEERIRCDVATEPDHAVVALRGELRLRTMVDVRTVLAKSLADRSRVIVDLSGVRRGWREAVQLFPAVHAAAGGWPRSSLVLYGATPGMAAALRSARIPRTVPLVRDRAAAERQMYLRPDRVHVERTLAVDTVAADLARAAARDACTAWEIGDLADTAAAVAQELVANAVQHARTDCRLKLSLDERGLWIETRDRGPGGRPATGAKPGTGHGMQLVDATAQQWGVTPHEQGKTVWALLDVTRS